MVKFLMRGGRKNMNEMSKILDLEKFKILKGG